jgi:hypothetical protein
MVKPPRRFLIAMVSILLAACENGPSAPTAAGHAGEWSGTTSQGSPITFSVSSSEKLRKISVGYSFNGCSGSSSLAPGVQLERLLEPVDVALVDFESAPPGTPNRMLFHFLFTSGTNASGMVTFADFIGCGTVNSTWTATRR